MKAPPKTSTPMPPTEGHKLQNKQAREKRREDWLAHNQEEWDAHSMAVFFPDVTDATILGIFHYSYPFFKNLIYCTKGSRAASPVHNPITPLCELVPAQMQVSAMILPPSTPSQHLERHAAAAPVSPFGHPRQCHHPPRSRTAHDVWYFFKKGVTSTTCIFCM